MNIGELRRAIAHIPDDATVVVSLQSDTIPRVMNHEACETKLMPHLFDPTKFGFLIIGHRR